MHAAKEDRPRHVGNSAVRRVDVGMTPPLSSVMNDRLRKDFEPSPKRVSAEITDANPTSDALIQGGPEIGTNM